MTPRSPLAERNDMDLLEFLLETRLEASVAPSCKPGDDSEAGFDSISFLKPSQEHGGAPTASLPHTLVIAGADTSTSESADPRPEDSGQATEVACVVSAEVVVESKPAENAAPPEDQEREAKLAAFKAERARRRAAQRKFEEEELLSALQLIDSLEET